MNKCHIQIENVTLVLSEIKFVIGRPIIILSFSLQLLNLGRQRQTNFQKQTRNVQTAEKLD